MADFDHALVARLVPHMRRLPGRLQALVSQIVRVRQAYRARTPGRNEITLEAYREALEAELAELEHMGREIASAAQLIRGILDGPDLAAIEEIHLALDEAVNGGSEDGE